MFTTHSTIMIDIRMIESQNSWPPGPKKLLVDIKLLQGFNIVFIRPNSVNENFSSSILVLSRFFTLLSPSNSGKILSRFLFFSHFISAFLQSNLQEEKKKFFPFFKFAWLNLLNKHMTTGRINQVRQ